MVALLRNERGSISILAAFTLVGLLQLSALVPSYVPAPAGGLSATGCYPH